MGNSQTAKEAAEAKVVSENSPKISTPIPAEEGLTVSVLPRSVWANGNIMPASEHVPWAYVDIFKGTSSTDTNSTIGLAQALGSNRENDPLIIDEFQHLEDIESIHVRLSAQTGSRGSCEITFINDLEDRAVPGQGKSQWERRLFKRGRFYNGAKIQYLNDVPNRNGNIWFQGTLTTGDPDEVVLDGIGYLIDWGVENGTPEGNIVADRVFAENMGELIFEPMQKIKVHMGNRFQPNVLRDFKYKTNSGEIPHMELPNRELTQGEILDYAGRASYSYGTNTFTGYLSEAHNSYSNGRWSVNIIAADVTCWLDYSMLNINPSIDLLNVDLRAYDEIMDWQLFTSRFQGVPAHEIIRAIFLGLRSALVNNTAGSPLYTSFEGDAKVKTAAGADLVIPTHSRVYIRRQYPYEDLGSEVGSQQQIAALAQRESNLAAQLGSMSAMQAAGMIQRRTASIVPIRYLVGTDVGDEGWMLAADLTRVTQTIRGIGNFLIDTDASDKIVPEYQANQELIETFANDRLIINPIVEPSDSYVAQAYRTYFRNNWPLVQSEYATRRSIVSDVCKHSNAELYADGSGKIWFHPVRAYLPVTDPVYIMHPEDTISWEVAVSDQEIITWAHVHGEYNFNIIPGEWLYKQELDSLDMVKRFGVRAIHISNPNLTDADAARAYARAMIRRINANMITGRITMILRPELRLARNVFIPWLNLIGYIANIDHSYKFGSSATTTISLKYVRHPWEPWFPMAYQAQKKQDEIDNPPRGGKAKASSGTHTAIRQDTTERAKPGGTLVKLQGHRLEGYVADAYSVVVKTLLAPVVGLEAVELEIIRTMEPPFSSSNDPHSLGTAVDIQVTKMKGITSASYNYSQKKAEARIDNIIQAFQKQGFIVVNKYEVSLNSSLVQGIEGYLELQYKRRANRV